MNPEPIEAVLRELRAARRRWSEQQFLGALVTAALIAGAVLVAWGAINRWLLGRLPLDWRLAAGAGGAAVAAALAITAARRRSLREMAGALDRLGATRDRFLSAVDFSATPHAEPMAALAVRECVAFVRAKKFAALLPLRLPRATAYLLVPVVTLALLQWEARDVYVARAAQAAAARGAIEDTAAQLEQLAQQTARAHEQAGDEALQRLAEQMQRGAEQMRAQATTPEEAGKAALRELSAIEQLVRDMQKTATAPTPEELQALAKALEENDATKEAAAALAAGDLAKAAAALEKAQQQLAEQKDETTPEAIQRALEQALKRLAEQKQLSEALQQLAQQMRRGAQPGGASSEAARQLAQMLRQMAQGQSGQAQNNPPSAQALQNLLSALQNMKFGEGQPSPGGQPQPGQTPGGVAMLNFSKDAPAAPPGSGDPQLPSGQPGSERDTGTTDSALGKDRAAAGQDARAEQLTGRTGEGESLQQSLLAAGDNAKSARRYKELYEAMAPAAQEAVLQENIPLGSRFFIKRYFEAIRPRE